MFLTKKMTMTAKVFAFLFFFMAGFSTGIYMMKNNTFNINNDVKINKIKAKEDGSTSVEIPISTQQTNDLQETTTKNKKHWWNKNKNKND